MVLERREPIHYGYAPAPSTGSRWWPVSGAIGVGAIALYLSQQRKRKRLDLARNGFGSLSAEESTVA